MSRYFTFFLSLTIVLNFISSRVFLTLFLVVPLSHLLFLLLFTTLPSSPLPPFLLLSLSFSHSLSHCREPKQSNRVPRGVRTSLVANVSGNLIAGLSRMSNDDSDHK